ncbi:phosphoenolpyruvate synthase [Methanococcus voltae]|uniref:Phosphoenolpyruvate synthase n=1 Tax=Methanococcus voltae TaxID=2188 RepID=A0A8J7RID4_METVO|nr:phosphoenolpyruvate synthase [Methanococcus voltae]MBP2172632.1 pyruvate,water dikinase [Methanococcus voltae]MBP2201461.1 pyruvate,water dikinase [Methanococcus voltae]
MKLIAWLDELTNEDVDIAGGKGASLGEMWNAKLPVPPAFVTTADAYRYFIEETNLKNTIKHILEGLDVNDSKKLIKASEDVRKAIETVEMPEDLKLSVIESYNKLSDGEDIFVAVRSSATAEDLPDASFAGQQETFLNMKGNEEVFEAVRKCYSSLFTPRAIFYREQKGFDHFEVALCAVVQKMADADEAGVMFTVNPINQNHDQMVIEAAWGYGEGVVSGTVSPDTYLIAKEAEKVTDINVASKDTMFIKNAEGKTEEIKTPAEKVDAQVLDEVKILKLAQVGKLIEKHYAQPMDIEWVYEGDELYMVQARPITTLDKGGKNGKTASEGQYDAEILMKGIGASPGTMSGNVKLILDLDQIGDVVEGDILVTKMTTPDMVPGMKKAAAIVTDDGGLTCHAAIISRELGTPCVVGTKKATQLLKNGETVTVDGEKGIVYAGAIAKKQNGVEQAQQQVVYEGAPVITATDIKVNVSMPEVAERAAATGADGVGLLRAEHMILGTGVHPSKILNEQGSEALVEVFIEGIKKVADAFYPRPVTYRTLDAPTDEFMGLEGGQDEPHEQNPMMGWRGIRRGLDQPEILSCELKAIKRLREDGYRNLNIMIPLVTNVDEIRKVKEIGKEVGLNMRTDIEFGIMVETPAAALIIEDIVKEGVDFISFGTNDLTQYVIAIDRNNEFVAKYYMENHPAVLKLIEQVIKVCRENDVKTSVCGQAGSRPAIVEKLVEWGITSISSNIDAVKTIRSVVARTEQKIILDSIRNSKK